MARSGINKREIDKWARNLVKETNKSLERAQRRNPPRVSAQIEATSSVVPGGEMTESNGYLARLLLWLDGRAKQNPAGYIDVAAFPEELQLEYEDPAILALQLEQHDLVQILRAMGPRTHVRLTDAGRVAVRQLKDLQKDRAARIRHTMDALLRWLFDTASDQTPINPALFLATPGSYFAGTEISGTDLHQALAYLAEHNLIDHIDTDPATVAITPQGTRCALAGGSVQDHVNQPHPGTTYNNYMPNAKGVIIGEQQHFTQNNADGVDPTLFAQLAGYIGQVSTTLGMSETDRVELERVAQDLHAEATSENPEPGRLRQFATQLKDKLLEAGTTIAATMGVQMADQALAALMQ
ncbi:hypothetical protein [Streptomyces griseocarneus]|uniref:hypothetical protein n=1 Tax=Streptomyces griseocarneus TaxID=51201 RepID=UPI00167E64C9|nr:hypothetical protein [Streptomyces griseocarneus]MBZ6478099.1 hypothetical protein [Streptomyces griseocarneus]GHG83745.1 hypothetical protein GCM10018779_67010 [Streptomyces griseocarneus]